MERSTCIVCKEEIIKDAKICIHCNNPQNWKRHIKFSSTILTLLISLLAIITSTFAILKTIPPSKKGEIVQMGWASSNPYSPRFWAINNGDEVGVLNTRAQFIVTDSNKEVKTYDAISHPDDGNSGLHNLILPGEAKVYNFQWNGVNVRDLINKGKKFHLVAEISSPKGTQRKIKLNMKELK